MLKNPLLETPGLLRGFLENFREFRKALKLELPEGAEKLSPEERAVREGSRFARGLSVLFHIALIALLVFAPIIFSKKEQKKAAAVEVVDISKYNVIFPVSKKPAGGGGGGGDRSKAPASKGRLPRFSLEQLTPPTAVTKNEKPELAAEPTVLVPPNIQFPNPPIPEHGDPISDSGTPANGPGSGSGIGTGSGGGVGPGIGPGVGPGIGGGYGGGAYRPGGGVSAPVCIYCPDPEFSEEAYKAKHEGVVVLWAVIDETGRVRHIKVQKKLGLGLDEAAVKAVMNWRFKPSERNGKSVPVEFAIEVTFSLH